MKKYLITTFTFILTNALFSQHYEIYKTEFYSSNGNLISSVIRPSAQYYINNLDDEELSVTTDGGDVINYHLGIEIESQEGKSFYMENANHKWFIIVFINDYILIAPTNESKPVTV